MGKYKILIIKAEEIERTKEEWEQQYTDESFREARKVEGSEDIRQFAYVNHKVTETVETTVLSQTINDLDIQAVIKAVNKI